MRTTSRVVSALVALLVAAQTHAAVVFDFRGSTSNGIATGVLTLADSYVLGAGIDASNFLSFSFSSPAGSFVLEPSEVDFYHGGLTATGIENNASGNYQLLILGPEEFIGTRLDGTWSASPVFFDDQTDGRTWTLRQPVPEPAPATLLLFGIAVSALVLRHRRRALT